MNGPAPARIERPPDLIPPLPLPLCNLCGHPEERPHIDASDYHGPFCVYCDACTAMEKAKRAPALPCRDCGHPQDVDTPHTEATPLDSPVTLCGGCAGCGALARHVSTDAPDDLKRMAWVTRE